MVSLFMSICGGVDWSEPYRTFTKMSSLYGWFFIAYIFLMHFGVLNVVIATFVNATMDSVSRDRDRLEAREMALMEDYAKKVTAFFKEADIDNSGTLSWDEFRTHMQQPTVKAYFQALQIDI